MPFCNWQLHFRLPPPLIFQSPHCTVVFAQENWPRQPSRTHMTDKFDLKFSVQPKVARAPLDTQRELLCCFTRCVEQFPLIAACIRGDLAFDPAVRALL